MFSIVFVFHDSLQITKYIIVFRIEQRLSEMWTKSTTEIKEGLDEILSIQKPKALMEKQLRRPSRPHRPRDRITHTLGLEPVPSEDAEYDGSSFSSRF